MLDTETVPGETAAGAVLAAAALGAVCVAGDPALAALAAANKPMANPKEQTRCKNLFTIRRERGQAVRGGAEQAQRMWDT
jgi:hypothetical protein